MSGTQNWMVWWGRLFLAVCVLLGAMALMPQEVMAQSTGATTSGDGAGVVAQILTAFYDSTQKWQDTLSTFAKSLFWILVGIELTWTAISLSIKGADLGEWLQEIVSQIFFIGFFAFLLFQASTILPAIVHSFTGAGNEVATNVVGTSLAGDSTSTSLGGIDPVRVFKTGWDLAWKVWASGSGATSVGIFILCAFSALFIVVIFGFMTSMMIVALVESYVYMSASVFFLGFGGSRWTKDYASKMLNLAVSVGAKLFMMILVVALSLGVIESLGDLSDIVAKQNYYVKVTPLGGDVGVRHLTYQKIRLSDEKYNDLLEQKRRADAERAARRQSGNSGFWRSLWDNIEEYQWFAKLGVETKYKEGAVRRLLMLIAALFVIFLLIKSLPNMIQGVLSGAGGGTSGAEAYMASKLPDPLGAAAWVAGTAYSPVAAMAMGANLGWNDQKLKGGGLIAKLGGSIGGAIKYPLMEAVKMEGDRKSGRRRYGPRAGLLRHIPHGLAQRRKDQKEQFETGKPGTSRDSGKTF